jgi:hypothetical protein
LFELVGVLARNGHKPSLPQALRLATRDL